MKNPLKKQTEEEKRTGEEFDATGEHRIALPAVESIVRDDIADSVVQEKRMSSQASGSSRC